MPGARQWSRGVEQRLGVLGTMLRRGALLLMITLTPLFVSGALAEQQSEYEVKAAFLYNFTKFVDWPPQPRPGQEPILICVIGDNPFGDSLDKIVAGKLVNGRSLRVRRLSARADARTCEIAFVSSSEKAHLRSILDALQGASVLTVGDTPQFAEMGGVVNFVLQDSLVHFEINVDAAQIQGLTISSRLLRLAKIVHNKNSGR